MRLSSAMLTRTWLPGALDVTASNPDRSRRLLFVGGRHRPRGLASRN
jgi:hypothetical protein